MIKMSNVSKKYENFNLSNINIVLEPGYIYGFVGQNGAGKTTTIKILMGLEKQDSGEITYFDNLPVLDAKQNVGFVYEDCSYYGHLKIGRMGKIISKFYKNWNQSVFDDYLLRFNLDINKKIDSLSKGMRMKFSLAAALSHKPKLLVMDEPTTGLDPLFRNELLDIFQEYIEDGEKTIFFSTHITSDLEKIADYIYFIDQGEIKLSAYADDLRQNYGLVKGSKDSFFSNKDLKPIGFIENDYQCRCLVDNRPSLSGVISKDFFLERATLEDIIIHYIKEEQNEIPSL